MLTGRLPARARLGHWRKLGLKLKENQGMEHGHYMARALPPELASLADIASDMRWSWSRESGGLWEKLDAALWRATYNPWLILRDVSGKRLKELSGDSSFVQELRRVAAARDRYLNSSTWFDKKYGHLKLGGIAYFCMEFGLSEALPIYSGGLGILAGDHLKAASDLGVPIFGVGLLYQQGYFRQAIGALGDQLEFYPYNNPSMLPITPVTGPDGEWLRVEVALPGRPLYLRCWQARVGRVTLYLLDSNDPMNTPSDRAITSELYGGSSLMRLQQEMALGIGGWRLLRSLGLDCEICHLNEGHAAFAVLERARDFMERTGQSFFTALRCTRLGNIFTTHTPVQAGFDLFQPELFAPCFENFARSLRIGVDDLLALGRRVAENRDEPFNMAYLAVRGCGSINAVSRLHGAVSRRIFTPLFPRWPESEVPVGHVTNGVHVPSWESAEADELWTRSCGETRWRGALEQLEEKISCLSDEVLWNFRARARRQLIDSLRRRLSLRAALRGDFGTRNVEQLLDYEILTVGFARRFTAYKRPNLLLHDPVRLERLLTDPKQPLQLVVAGKAHPQDGEGKRMVREWNEFVRKPQVRGRAVFVEDYDMALAAELVRGVDVWVNNPRRPWEACGTSGMKLLANGGLNASELDGWWAEAYSSEVGWALGDGQEHGDDPNWDAAEADALYALLEREIIPAFYQRSPSGIPVDWVRRMRASMAQLTGRFSANRMVREYVERYYIPNLGDQRMRGVEVAKELEAWHRALALHWAELRIADFHVQQLADNYQFRASLSPGKLRPEWLRVELYAEPLSGAEAERIPMNLVADTNGAAQLLRYEASVRASRPAEHYTPRVFPQYPGVRIPLEEPYIYWFR
jgi:starch phosphorylase